MAQRQIINGNFQDALGNPLALGYLKWRLNVDGTTGSNEQISAGRVTTVPLDVFGNVDGVVEIWPNDQLTPSGTTYTVKAFTFRGQFVWESLVFALPSGVGPYNLGGPASPAFLLLESGGYILLESGGRIELE